MKPMSDKRSKEYTNGEVTILWKPGLCIHSGNCVRGLPEVFKPKERPWIKPEGINSEKLASQVNLCPSGALSSYYNNEKEIAETMENKENTQIEVLKDGPVKVVGPCTVMHSDGTSETKEKAVFLCRCGGSSKKPFCDGSHKKLGFEG
jgi:uncharacterized Fe-S cluster protein YjdI